MGKPLEITYFQEPDGRYVAVTSESTMGGTVFVGRGSTVVGGGPESVGERAFHVNQLKRCRKVEFEDVPADWLLAFGYHTPPEPAPEPAEEPAEPEEAVIRQPRPQRTVIDVTWWPFSDVEEWHFSQPQLFGYLLGLLGWIAWLLLFQ